MKDISAFLSGCLLLSALFKAEAQRSPRDFPSKDFMDNDSMTVKTCYDNDSECTLRVAMACTYTDQKGETKNCMDTSSVKANRPFLTLSKDECKARGSILATITYTTCNENNVDFKPIPRKNDIRFRKDTSVKPGTEWDEKLAPNTCRQYDIEEKFDLCKRRRVMENQFDGDLNQDYPKYCRCFLYKQSFILLTTPPPKGSPNVPTPSPPPTMSPSSGPTMNPTKGPSPSPTSHPSEGPTKSPSVHPTFHPTKSPTESPVVPQCDERGGIITEIVSPFGNDNGRYIELYFGDTCGNHVIENDILVRRYIDGEDVPLQEIPLKDEVIPDDGFFVICMDEGANALYGDNTCDYVNDSSLNPFDIDGTDSFEMMEFDSPEFKPLDMYGRKSPHNQEDQDFTGGRSVRKLQSETPSPIWNPQHWHVIPGTLSTVTPDPREWGSVTVIPDCNFFLTELADPVDVPLAAFIEIKTTCPGAPIPTNLYVRTWKFSYVTQYLNPPVTYVPADSFIIICKDKAVFETTFPGKACDIENVPLQPGGVHPIGLYKDYVNTPIDIYGSTNHLPSVLFFLKGRAYRKLSAPQGSDVCAPKDWVVIPGSTGGTVTALECDPRDWKAEGTKLYFTELADPSDDPDKRFIELYSPNRRHYAIEEPLVLTKHDPMSKNIIGTYSLTSVLVNGDGFLVVCAQHFDRCTSIAGPNSIINSAGTYSWTLQSCPPNGDCEVIDSYGFGCFSGDHSYEDGRAVRKKDAQPKPSPEFYLSHWDIYKSVPFSETTPGEWEDEDDKDNQPTSPSPPASAPSTGKGKGKGLNKSKRKTRKKRRM